MIRALLGAAALLVANAAMAEPLDAQRRSEVLNGAAALIETRYVYADRGQALAGQLRDDARRDRFAGESDPKAFAKAMTVRLRELSGDGHLGLDYSETPLPPDRNDAEAQFTAAEMERFYGAHLNHGFEQVARLEGNIGYLDLRVFAPSSMAGDVTAAAMTLLAQSDALIVDLRKNGGGASTELISAYLFDARSRPLSGVYKRATDTLTPTMTPEWVPGRRFGSEKPVYILISKRTFSAAEAFAYDLQALGRATIVGQRSGGGAHPFEYRRVDPHFVLSLAEARSINPITGKDWQGTGVTPDVEIDAERALDKALDLARAELERRKTQAAP